MKAVLIEDNGSPRLVEAMHLPVRVPVAHPVSFAFVDKFDPFQYPTFDVVEYVDTGLRTADEMPVLRPAGEAFLLNYPGPLWRRGRTLWADVLISEAEIAQGYMSAEELALRLAKPHLTHRAPRFVVLGEPVRRFQDEPEGRRIRCYRVYAEERVALTEYLDERGWTVGLVTTRCV